MSDLMDPTPLPAEVAVDEPPIPDEILAMFASGALSPDPEAYADDPPMDEGAAHVHKAGLTIVRWEIKDEGEAEWAGGHLTRRTDEVAALERQARDFHRRVDRWLEQNAGPSRRLISLFEHKLIDWAARKREESRNAKGEVKVKSWSTPSVSISSRSGQDKLEVTDEDALLKWLKESVTPEEFEVCVRTTEKPLLTGLKSTFTTDANGKVFYQPTGESPPGLAHVHADVSFSVKPS